jgi:single-strand DNA-binding protein
MLPEITVVGNLKRIEMKYTQSNKAVTKFQIECAEKNAKGEWTNLYLSGECWEKQAEFVNQYFKDGSPAIVTGKLYTNIYEKQDGGKVYENKLLFPKVSFIPKDKSGEQEQPQQPQRHTDYQTPQGYGNGQKMPPQQQAIPDIDMESIPF